MGSAKPDAKIFEVAMSAVACASNEMIHIGDSIETDVKGAINAGVTPIWFNADGDDNSLGIREVRSLTDLPAAIDSLIA